MGLINVLEKRSENKCELCSNSNDLRAIMVAPKVEDIIENQVVLCVVCDEMLSGAKEMDANHMRCLNESIWSEVSAVKVISYRLLDKLKKEPWATDLLGMMYMEESELEWAQQGLSSNELVHKDSNGNILTNGDNVVLIQDLNVKGGGFTAKRGTAVRRIRLVHDNAEHIEGKIEGQNIVILTKYVKKS